LTTTTLSLTCEAGLCGIKPCSGIVALLWETLDCSHGCHDPAPVEPEEEIEDLLDREADAHLWDWAL
jgi:hypothetical protein